MSSGTVHGRNNIDYDTLIFDIGDVLFTWSAQPKIPIEPKTFRRMLETPIWNEYEKGKTSEAETYNALANEFGIQESDIWTTINSARETLSSRPCMVDLIKALKPGRKVYAMSNISAPDWEYMRALGSDVDWDIFDAVFTSAAAGERKPQVGFYQHVLQQTGADPARTIFVDDKCENLVAARAFGITTIMYDNFENVERALRNLCGDPIARGERFLLDNAGRHLSRTSDGHVIHENFSQLLILEATKNPALVDYTKFDGSFNFFRGPGVFTTADYPDDLDTTAVAFTVTPDVVDKSKMACILDGMLDNCDTDGIPMTYFDKKRPRRDHNVCVNILTLFYANGRGHELDKTLDWIYLILKHRAYLEGTRYYPNPEVFLFFMSRLMAVAPSVRQRMGTLFKECCQEHLGGPGDALGLAMRIHCCNEAGLDASIDLRRLLAMQEVDGGWKDGWFYKYGTKAFKVENRGLTTALALQAIRGGLRGVKLEPSGQLEGKA